MKGYREENHRHPGPFDQCLRPGEIFLPRFFVKPVKQQDGLTVAIFRGFLPGCRSEDVDFKLLVLFYMGVFPSQEDTCTICTFLLAEGNVGGFGNVEALLMNRVVARVAIRFVFNRQVMGLAVVHRAARQDVAMVGAEIDIVDPNVGVGIDLWGVGGDLISEVLVEIDILHGTALWVAGRYLDSSLPSRVSR